MPTDPTSNERAAEPRTGAAAPPREVRRVRIDPGGPVLVEGPVEVVLPNGETVVSERFQVALCACRRSRTYPWCDTSHRRRARPGGGQRPPARSQDDADGGSGA